MSSYCNGQTDSCSALRGGDGSRYSRCRFRVLQKPILGTADSEYWHCLGVRSFLLEIPHASMIARHKADITTAFRMSAFGGIADIGQCPLMTLIGHGDSKAVFSCRTVFS